MLQQSFDFRKKTLYTGCAGLIVHALLTIFEAYSGLKSRGLGDFGSPSGREEIIEKLL